MMKIFLNGSRRHEPALLLGVYSPSYNSEYSGSSFRCCNYNYDVKTDHGYKLDGLANEKIAVMEV